MTDLTEEIVRRYTVDMQSTRTIAAELKMGRQRVQRVLRERGVMRAYKDTRELARHAILKYQVDETFFETIDTLPKCWVLGWMYSDGYNCVESNEVRIGIQREDEEVLEQISTLLSNTRPIMHEPDYPDRSTLIISRKKVSQDLAKLGCFQAKSLTIEFPHQILDTRAKTCAFLRGIVDGDGTIATYHPKGEAPHIVLTIACGSPLFVEALRVIFLSYWGINGVIMRRGGAIIGIRFRAKRQVMRSILTDLYDTGAFPHALQRKLHLARAAIALLDDLMAHPRGYMKRITLPGSGV